MNGVLFFFFVIIVIIIVVYVVFWYYQKAEQERAVASAAAVAILPYKQSLLNAGVTEITYMAHGGCAYVYSARYNGQNVAVKVPRDVANSQHAKMLFSEAECMDALRHRHVMPRVIIPALEGEPIIVMPHCRPLKTVLNATNSSTLFLQVAAGLEHIESCDYVHCDVKLENVLVNSSGDAVVSDFGMTRKATLPIPCGWGTPAYLAEGNACANTKGAAAIARVAMDIAAFGHALARNRHCWRPECVPALERLAQRCCKEGEIKSFGMVVSALQEMDVAAA